MSDLLDLGLEPTGRRRRRRAPRAVLALVLVVVLAALGAGVALGGRALFSSFGGSPSAPDYPGPGTGQVNVQVKSGDSAGRIATTLAAQDVVKSETAFTQAAALNPRSRTIQAGFYLLRMQMSGDGALAALLDPASRARTRVVVPEGSSLAIVLQKIAASSDIPAADLKAAAGNPAALGLPDYAKGRLEGFLFPATYDIEPGTTALQALTMMVARFKESAAGLDLPRRAAAIGRTPYQVLITASLIEKETAFPDDRAKVARVVYNRLAAGMRLEFDSTVNYLREEKKARLSIDDTKVESAYNTYQIKGLPPTPINSPGEAALTAALNPAAGDYVFFVTVAKDGHSLFTKSYKEFLNAKAKAQAEGVY